MSIKITLTDSIDVIQNRVNGAIAEVANKNIQTGRLKAQSIVRDLVKSWVMSQPEMQSIISVNLGSLAGQFGIPVGQSMLAYDAIASSVANSVTTNFTSFNKKNLSGNFSINIQPEGFKNLLSLQDGHVIFPGGDLHWLDWLLTKGDTIIVANYQYNPKGGAGRSRLGYMTVGSSFRVPPQFSGTAENNFITRALTGESQEKQISDVLERLVSGNL